jgi:hypothetical protein
VGIVEHRSNVVDGVFDGQRLGGQVGSASSCRDMPTPRCSTMMTSSPSATARRRSPRYNAIDAAPGPPG